jgi:taurine dioxygenase
MSITITPITPILGAEVHGVHLSEGVDDETFAILHEAFLDHGVLVFREQGEMAPDVHVEFARRLGPLHEHPAAPAEHENPAVFLIRTHRGSPISNGNGWHSDVSCDELPPSATMLQVRVLPEGGGGDTLFADMEAAYATLEAGLRRRLCGLSALHASEHIYKGRYADRGAEDEGITYPEAVHPVVRSHPETGRRSLFVNPSFTVGIEGLGRAESDGLLSDLHAHCARPEIQIRLRWNRNDVALWDNRRVQHFAIWDYWPDERSGHRVTVQGDRPFFDPDGDDPPPSQLRMSIGRLA